MDVEGEPNALELLVDAPMTDNSTVKVTFQDKRNPSSVIASSNTVYCKLTDGYQPSALKVNVVDNRTLEIEFSEAVLRSSHARENETANYVYAADRVENYKIDARDLSLYDIETTPKAEEDYDPEDDEVYKISQKDYFSTNQTQKGSVTVGTYRNGVDDRHVVTIQLGENSSLKAGPHSISISNVGDWAAKTDGWRNIINTSTIDFVIPDNNEAPTFDLEVMSPEQYKLTANCDIGIVNPNKTFKVYDSSKTEDDIVILEQEKAGEWVPISNDEFTEEGCGYNPIMVSRVIDVQDGIRKLTNEYLVETRVDWTQVLHTKKNKRSYDSYNYRLRIPAGSIRNLANSKTNEEITIPLNDPIMKSIDGQSPTLKSIEQVQDKDGNLLEQYRVTFDEPVKLSYTANREGLTPSQDLLSSGSMYSAYFAKQGSTEQIQAVVNTNSFVDALDTTIQVEPVDKLSAGDWDLYVRGVADDYGNTVSTVKGTVHVDEEVVDTDFKVVWAAVSATDSYDGITAGEGHYIFVKFNKPIKYYGGSTNVTSTLNYQLNGSTLPTGSNIKAHIKNYDAKRNDERGIIDSITISLPNGTNSTGLGSTTMNYPVSGKNCILTISNAITSLDGDPLATESGYNMPYQYGETNGLAYQSTRFDNLTAAGDAVWGNDSTDKSMEQSQGYDSKENYIKALKDALKNDKYRKIVLDDKYAKDGEWLDLGTLTIDRIVDIDLNGCNILGNITISTTTAAKPMEIVNSNTGRTSSIAGKAIGEGSVTLTVNMPYTDLSMSGSKYLVIHKGASEKAMNINGMPSDTFRTDATVIGEIVLAADNMGMVNSGDLSKAPITVNAGGKVKLEGDYKDTTVTLSKKTTLNLEKVDNIKVIAAVKDSTVIINNSVSNVTIVAKADDIIVKYDDKSKVTLKSEGGTFKHQMIASTDEPADKAEPQSIGAESWIKTLTVIDGAENGGLAEVITVGAISGGSVFKSGEEQNIETGFKKQSDNDYEIVNVNLSSSAAYLSVNNNTGIKTVTVKTGVTTKTVQKFTVKITVKDKKTGDTSIITKEISVTIDPSIEA